MSQQRSIHQLLLDRPEGITALDALRECGSLRLAARVADLRAEGIHIESEMVTLDNGKRVARYRIVEATFWS